MPYSDPEKKKEYNRLYYIKNKLRINAERIVKDVKDEKQRCILPTSLLKYDEALDDNQTLFLTDLVEKCKNERKRLYELPPPAPIVEDPTIVKEIPFIPVLPIVKTFKKNTNVNTFTSDEARAIVHTLREVDNGGTESTRMTQINGIMTHFNLDKETGIWSDVYKKGFDEIIRVLTKAYKNPSNYISFLLYVYDSSSKLKEIVDKQDTTKTLIEKLKEEKIDSTDREKVLSRENKKDDMTNYIQHYNDLFSIEEEYANETYGSMDHLVSLMYSKGLLNNENEPIFIPRNSFADVKLITNDEKEIITRPKTAGSGYNYYNTKTGRLFLQSYKTKKKYGNVDIVLSNYTIKAIKQSLILKPRDWLFTTVTTNSKYKNNSSFGNVVSDKLGITINQIRRAFINYYLHFIKKPRNEIAKLAKHSVETDEFTYSTQESNEALQNTTYDVNVIGKRVDVKITEGRKLPNGKYNNDNVGKTLIGRVFRSLKPNRHKFGDREGLPYQIKFDKDDNNGIIEDDNFSDKIPDTEDGITMHKERHNNTPSVPVPVSVARRSTRNNPSASTSKSKGKGKGKGKGKKGKK